MKKLLLLIPVLLLTQPALLLAQGQTRQVTLSWGASTSPATSVIGYNILSSNSAAGPFVQIACVGTGTGCVAGTTSLTLTWTDPAEPVGSTIYYELQTAGIPCTGTTPVGTPCGVSVPTSPVTVPIPAKTSSPTSIVVIVQQ